MHAIARRRNKATATVLTLVALVVGLIGLSPLDIEPANAAPVYGGVRIVDQHGDPVSGAYVELRPSSGSSDRYATWTASDGTGRVPWYLVTDLQAMLVAVLPYQSGADPHYNWVGGSTLEASDGAPTAVATFSPSSSVLLELIAPIVLPSGQLRGTVTLGNSTLGAQAAVIDLYAAGTGDRIASVRPGPDGSFAFTHVPHGSYKLLFQSYAPQDGAPHGFTPRWYDDKASISTATVVVLTEGQVFSGIDQTLLPRPAQVFSDVPYENQFFTEIAWLESSGITTGYPDGTFRPLGTVSRDAMAAFLYRFAGQPTFTPPTTSPFSDVPTTSQFYTEVTWLASTGITTGYPDGSFRPSGTVNRDAMAAFLYRFADRPPFTPPAASPFSDVPTSDQFYKEITWLAGTGVTTGYPDGSFRPLSTVNRDAMAAFLYRFLDID